MSDMSIEARTTVEPNHHSRSGATVRAVETLRTKLNDGSYIVGEKLPSEPTLAKELGVSRVTVRAALSHLESEGLIDRRHGAGTFVNPIVPLTASLDLNIGADALIRSKGYEPGVSQLSWKLTQADEKTAEKLQLEEGTAIIHLYRVRTADGVPVTIEHDFFADALVPAHPPNIGPSLYSFLSETCGVQAAYGMATLEPAHVGPTDGAVFGVSPDALCLTIRQVDYDSKGVAVSYSVEKHLATAFDFRLLRQGPDTNRVMPSTDR